MDLFVQENLSTYGPMPRFGYSMSPLVDGDQVLALVGKREEGPGIIAFDRMTGEIKWEALSGPAGYSSPLIAEIGGRKQYVHTTSTAVVGLSTDGYMDGKMAHNRKGDGILDGPTRWKVCIQKLHDKGYSDEDLQKIMGLNFLRVYRKVLE